MNTKNPSISLIKSLIKEEVSSILLKEEKDPYIVYGDKVEDFINDTILLISELEKEGEEIVQSGKVDPTKHNVFVFVSSRLGFLKNLKYKLAQKYEGFRRED